MLKTIAKDTFDAFLEEIEKRSAIRLVKVIDFGHAEPKRVGGAFVMQPYVTIIATAYDKTQHEIIRWEESKEAQGTMVVTLGSAYGLHADPRASGVAQNVMKRLELEGYSVARGEWTSDQVEQLLKAAG